MVEDAGANGGWDVAHRLGPPLSQHMTVDAGCPQCTCAASVPEVLEGGERSSNCGRWRAVSAP